MNRRTILAGSLATGLAPLNAVAQDDTPPDTGADVPNRLTRRTRIEVARRWEEEVKGLGELGAIRDLTSSDHTSPITTNAPGIDALYDRFASTIDSRAAQYTSYSISAEAFAVSSDSVSVRTLITAEANGRRAETTGMTWYVFGDDNLVRSAWSLVDEVTLTSTLFD